MSTRSIAARRQRRREILLGALALVVALIMAGAALALFLGNKDSALDPETLCPLAGAKGHVILLVDTTDPFNFTQKQAFMQYVAEFGRGKVMDGELLSVFALGEDFISNAKPVFEMCNPGRGDDKSIWTSNPEKLRKLFDDRFNTPMTHLADRLAGSAPSPNSPIMEMLQLVAINGFRSRNIPGPRHLFVVSDMLQNTPVFSQYRGETEFKDFKNTALFQKVRTDLAKVDVELAYLLTNPQRQNRRHLKFWEDYFQELGAAVVSVHLLEG